MPVSHVLHAQVGFVYMVS